MSGLKRVKQVSKPAVKPIETPQDIKSNYPWMNIAIKENGVSEIFGSKHNPRILEYHAATSLKATTDEVPWCSAFVSWCLEQAKIKSKRSARAADYLSFGVHLDKPVYGCIVVFKRSGGNHVAFFIKEDNNGIYCLGGNQHNQVCYSYYPKENLLGYRMPSGF